MQLQGLLTRTGGSLLNQKGITFVGDIVKDDNDTFSVEAQERPSPQLIRFNQRYANIFFIKSSNPNWIKKIFKFIQGINTQMGLLRIVIAEILCIFTMCPKRISTKINFVSQPKNSMLRATEEKCHFVYRKHCSIRIDILLHNG